jgi:hypothetical protein
MKIGVVKLNEKEFELDFENTSSGIYYVKMLSKEG